ncbi:MAG TPA: hypothetical protein VF587_17890 [Solirubrobacteraceae bacterium]|jgi:hypothetical protein
MAIRFPEPPDDVARAARPERPGGGAGAFGFDAPAPGGAPAVPPHQVFTAGLDQLTAAERPEMSLAAEPTWRVSTLDREGRPAAAEMRPDELGGAPASVGEDRFGPAIQEALTVAGGDARVQGADYEARLFRVPALKVLALWLHDEQHPDLFVPLEQAAGVTPHRVYDHEAFMAALRGAAEGQLAHYRDAERPDELGS